MELVSAIITTYKRPIEILQRALISVVNQTYSPIEIIVVNDYPENGELSMSISKLVKDIDSKIIYIEHEKNKGANAARNTGLARAKGVYVSFLDDDDEWLTEKITLQVEQMDHNTGLVYCDSINYSGKSHYVYRPRMKSKNELNAILRGNFIGSASFPLLKTDLIRQLGGFDENLVSCQDYDLWIRVVASYPIKYLNIPLVKYYLSEDSTFKKSNKKYIDGDQYILNKYKKLYVQYPNDYLYHLNDVAISALLFKGDINMYMKYKLIALRFKFFHRYNFFLVIIKLCRKLNREDI